MKEPVQMSIALYSTVLRTNPWGLLTWILECAELRYNVRYRCQRAFGSRYVSGVRGLYILA